MAGGREAEVKTEDGGREAEENAEAAEKAEGGGIAGGGRETESISTALKLDGAKVLDG